MRFIRPNVSMTCCPSPIGLPYACHWVPATRDLFHDNEFARMKRTAYIVCVTRGKIINTDALLRALEARKIAGQDWT